MAMQIELSDGRKGGVSTGAELVEWLDALSQGACDFAVLARGPQHYVQAAFEGDGYIVEKRDGGEDRHYRGERTRPPVTGTPAAPSRFALDDVQLIFEDYLAGRDSAAFVRWRKVALGQPLPAPRQRIVRGIAILIVFALVAVAGIWAMGGFG